ncbi:MAG: crotonase/enoyl-CoA hydratase family protein [Candidatus Competibacteraceae bacterium]|jgi:enoyl-CoA hydratase|nr:crotonase/enoyl-CoA hydratase family protein [Candidatus Competibacteraceae bacterium]
MPDYSSLKVTIADHVAQVELNRPHKANALDKTLWYEIRDAFIELDQTPEARVIILNGAGKYFSAGIDFELIMGFFAEVNALPPGRKEERLREIILDLQAAFTAVETCRKPVLATVHGLCLGAGLDLIAACDMRYASADATFSLKEVDLGIVADIGSLQRLPHLIGEGLVRELAFTGRDVSGAEAQSMGLVNRVFDSPQQLFAGVHEIAQCIAAKSPLTVRGIKHSMNYNREHSVADGLNQVATWNSAMLLSEDSQEAVLAATQKRIPQFKD